MQTELVSDTAEVVVLKVVGRISGVLGDSEPLADRCGPEIYKRRVLVDLSDTDFIDSSGIGLLLRTHKRFVQAGGRLVLWGPPPLVHSTLRMLRMDLVLHLAATPENARTLAMEGANS